MEKKLIPNCLVGQKEALEYTQSHDEGRWRLKSRQGTGLVTEQGDKTGLGEMPILQENLS